VLVRRPEELARVDGLVLPGGESTTIVRLARIFDLLEPLREAVRGGMPTYGSCAGMILLADRLANPAPVPAAPGGVQETIGGIDMTVRRNAFGRQVDSFETDLAVDGVDGGPVHAVFIRAPWVEDVGPGATPLAHVDEGVEGPAAGRVVVIRQGALLATAFHPELTGDTRVHEYFCRMVKEVAA
jgi:pyridoxal 5'-phosphate synthase pdxT subunit